MLIKRNDGIPSNPKEHLYISTLSNSNNNNWIYTDEGWIKKPIENIETSNNGVSK